MNSVNKTTILIALIVFLSAAIAGGEIVGDPLKTATAHRTDDNMRIDGILNEPDWKSAPEISGFRQLQPDEGQPASESTLVKVLYDDAALYVGVICFDREPDRITRVLTRRDTYTESDRVNVRFDSHHDHQTAYLFEVNASGVMRDILFYNNDNSDVSWDAVWEADTKIHKHGWTAEFKIPYSALRFGKKEEYLWGFDIVRYIPRKNEVFRWQFVPQSETGGVSRYGHLAGIKGIEPPGRIESLPYFVSYGKTEPKSLGNIDGRDFFSNVGVDFKYGISSSMTLDAAVNPDFGQVESDPSVMNLTAFELFFEEKRPFFLEGSEIFRTPFIHQFYSRRIGRAPSAYPPENGYFTDKPNNTTILNALKLTGKTAGGTSIGVLNVTTQEEKAKYMLMGDPKTYETLLEPMANYTVARVKQDIFGSSYVGGMVTSANQKEITDAYTASADWNLYFNKHMFSFNGILIGTNNGPGTGDYAVGLLLGKNSGKLVRGNINAQYIGRKTDWNRLGFMGRNGYRAVSSWIQFYSNKRFSIFRYMGLNFNQWYNQLLDGHRSVNGGNVNGTIIFTNNYYVSAGVGYDGSRYGDRETFGNGLIYFDSNTRWWVGGGTNEAKKFCIGVNYHHDNEHGGLFNLYELWSNLRLRSNFELSLSAELNTNRGVDFWVGTGEDGLPVMGKIDNNDLDITLRGTYTFARNLSLQWYTQAYISNGEYKDFYKLSTPETMEKVDPAEYEIYLARGDFNYKSLNVNLVLRWEYMRGSTIYVVWTQARDRYDTDYGDFDFSRDMDNLFSLPQTNTFLVKANYWWNI